MRKGSKASSWRASRPKKRKNNLPIKRANNSSKIYASSNASSERLKNNDYSSIEHDVGHGYAIINIISLFTIFQDLFICRACHGDVNLSIDDQDSLGFKINVNCKCSSKKIPSCPTDGNKYEINRRMVFVMRLLGIGLQGMNKFCGLMDMSRGFTEKSYYDIVDSIHSVSTHLFRSVIEKAAKEEKVGSTEAELANTDFSVSENGTWHKRELTSLIGVATLIGKFSNAIIDLVVKSENCESCTYWKGKENTVGYVRWAENHRGECMVNNLGSTQRIQSDAVSEMFSRSKALHSVTYRNCVSEKTTRMIDHMQKCMGKRLRQARVENKGIGGKGPGMLTGKIIDGLITDYGLALRNNRYCIEDMKKAVWAMLNHKCSSDDNPQHQNCPPGEQSWCEWQRAETQELDPELRHDPPLDNKVQVVIRPIFEDLSSEKLLSRCLEESTENSMESFNSMFWQFAPKHEHCDLKILETAAYLAASIFNDGYYSILTCFSQMGLVVGTNAYQFARERDEHRIRIAERRCSAIICKKNNV